VRVFLMGDGVSCALCGQKTPDGYCNVERMLQSIEAPATWAADNLAAKLLRATLDGKDRA